MVAYASRAVETEIVTYVDAALADPHPRLHIGLLTGSPRHGIDAVLAHGVVPRIAATHGPPARVHGAWDEPAADTGPVRYCLAAADVPAAAPPPESPARVLLVTCTDVRSLPDWLTADPAAVRTLPIGHLSVFEAHATIAAQLGDRIDPRSAYVLAAAAGFLPVVLEIIVGECRAAGVLARVDGLWRLFGDPVAAAVVPYLRAQLASADPAYAQVMFHLALREPFAMDGLAGDETAVAHDLLRDGELHRRGDGLVEFAAPAASRALRAVAPPDTRRSVYAPMLESGEPGLRAIAWALRSEPPVGLEQLAGIAAAPVAAARWPADELVDLAAAVDGSGAVPDETACRIDVHTAYALCLQLDHDRARARLRSVDDRRARVTGVDTTEIDTGSAVVRAWLRRHVQRDPVGALHELAAVPARAADGLVRGHVFLHRAHGGGHAEILAAGSEAPVTDALPESMRAAVAAADLLLTTAAGTPQAALVSVTEQVSGGAVPLDAVLRAATAAAALAAEGPDIVPDIEWGPRGTTPPNVLAVAYLLRAEAEYVRGAVAAARDWATAAIAAVDAADPWSVAPAATALRAETAALAGDTAAAGRDLARIDTGPGAPVLLVGGAYGHVAAAQILRRTPRAGDVLRTTAASLVADGLCGAAADALYAGVRLGHRRAARDLLRVADRLDGRVHRLRIAHAQGLLADDPLALAAVADELHDAGLHLHAAEAAAAAAALPTAPRSLRDRLRGRVATYLSEQPVPGHPLLGRSGPQTAAVRLTPRERDVARLIDAGLSNAEIAAHLHLAPATVEGHITRLYRKTGATRRSPGRR